MFHINDSLFITGQIAFIFTSLSTVHINDFHIFTVIYVPSDRSVELVCCQDLVLEWMNFFLNESCNFRWIKKGNAKLRVRV